MSLNYNSIDILGVAAEPIIEEILFENVTIGQNLVTFEDNIKAETIFTETSAVAIMQAYTSGAPGATGSFNAFDTKETPTKVMFYQEFDPNTLRFSRFKRDMKPGAWEVISGEFERIVIGGQYAKQISLSVEDKFWNSVTSATKATIAGLTASSGITTYEQAKVAALTTGLVDGIVAKLVYNDSNANGVGAVGGRISVTASVITATNIKAEYDKVYAKIPDVIIAGAVTPAYIFAPRSHKSLINLANNNTTNYTKPFDVTGDVYSYNGVEIKFVPLPADTMIAARKECLHWLTDLTSDINVLKIDKIALNREDMFFKSIMTLGTHVSDQSTIVLYA